MTLQRDWAGTAERGSLRALRFLAWFYDRFGRRVTLLLLGPTAVVFFFVRDAGARRASRLYLETLYATPEGRRALGRAPGVRNVLRHLLEFAVNIFDRMVVWAGQFERIQIEHAGSEHLFRLARERRGGILLGAHLGSFDVMRVLAGRHGLAVNVLMFTEHAERINAFFEQLDPTSRVRVIQLDPHSVRTAFEIKACIDRGEFVGILADRVIPGGRQRVARTTFLGRECAFPLTPFLLAAQLGCPLLVSLCVRTGEARYEAVVQPLATQPGASRREREKQAREHLQSYVQTLETWCQRAPYQWFNFYDFWAAGMGAAAEAPTR